MIFITLNRDNYNTPSPVTVRGDHLLQISDFRKDGEVVGTWCLIQHTGWLPALHTQEEILAKIAAAKDATPSAPVDRAPPDVGD